MRLFTPPGAPAWLDPLLRRITQGLREPWDSPLRLKSLATAELPTAADYPGGIVYDSTAAGLKLSDGATWAAVGGGGGVSDGDKGDITVSGVGTVWTVDAGSITLAKQANVATATVFYRKTAGAGAPEVQTLATLKTDLGLTGTNSGDQDLSSYATTAAVAAGYQPLDTQLTDLAGLSYGSNALKVVRVNAGATGWELATVSSGGISIGQAIALSAGAVTL